MKLKGLATIVTGAGGGFGEGIARLFAQEGAQVVVADIRHDAAKQVADKIVSNGGEAVACHADVSLAGDVEAMVQLALERFHKLDVIVNNAGTTHKSQPMLNVDEKTFDLVYAVNVKSIFHAAKSAVPVFRRQGYGNIINIASTAGVRPRPGLTWYNGSKGAVNILTKSMALELAPDKIRVNAINPVMGETGLLSEFLPGEDTVDIRQKIINTIPLGRFSQPRDIAKACAFLASDQSEFITGVCLEVDGGRCI